jgi:Protein of unknown function (DUF4058)
LPLRDHFRPPLDDWTSWDGFHAQWPAMIVMALFRQLPPHYVAAPNIHLGAPPMPTLAIATDLPDQDEYEVRVYDTRRGRRLVAAIEIVSPANKDRPEHRRAFVVKCAALLRERACVAIVDLVTTCSANLYADLLELHGMADPLPSGGSPPLYAVSCRWTRKEDAWILENWAHSLTLGEPLPTLPLWLAEDLAVPLELEPCYEETCRVLRIS